MRTFYGDTKNICIIIGTISGICCNLSKFCLWSVTLWACQLRFGFEHTRKELVPLPLKCPNDLWQTLRNLLLYTCTWSPVRVTQVYFTTWPAEVRILFQFSHLIWHLIIRIFVLIAPVKLWYFIVREQYKLPNKGNKKYINACDKMEITVAPTLK
jgi:hypothetical protein